MLVLYPDLPGGMRELFAEYFKGAATGGAADVTFFPIHDRRPCVILRFPAKLVRLFIMMRRRRYSLCHFNVSVRGSFVRYYLIAGMCRSLHIRYVVHMHGGEFREFYGALPGFWQWFVVATLRNAAGLIVLGNVWKDFVVNIMALRKPRTYVLYNAVHAPRVLTRSYDERKPTIAFLGVLTEGKGIFELIRVLAARRLRLLEWNLVVAGAGEDSSVRRFVAENGLAGRVEMTGWLDRAATQQLLCSSDIFCLPSRAEGLPLALLEAMGCGCCCVATDVGAVREALTDRVDGLVIPPCDETSLEAALCKVLVDPGLRKRLGAGARATWSARFDKGQYWRRLELIYEKVLCSPGES